MLPDTAEHRQDTIQLQARLAAVMSTLAAQSTAVERLRGERDILRAERDTANTEVEKLRLMIRQLELKAFRRRFRSTFTSRKATCCPPQCVPCRNLGDAVSNQPGSQ